MLLADVFVWDGKELVVRTGEDIESDLLNAMSFLRDGMVQQGYRMYDAEHGARFAVDELMLAITPTSVIGFNVAETWFSPEKIIGEEFIGPRIGCVVDMADAVACLSAIAKRAGCPRVCLGTRSNSRHVALARLLERTGCRISTIELTKEIIL
ncbi:hypothetical protein Kurepalu1_00036 [Pseudomonas phage vB_PpuP-Kurepalu-1]